MDYEIVFIVILVFILLLISTIYIYNYFNSNQITKNNNNNNNNNNVDTTTYTYGYMPDKTVLVNYNKEAIQNSTPADDLHLYFKYCSTNDKQQCSGGDLPEPRLQWSLTGNTDTTIKLSNPEYSATLAGAGKWQILTLPPGKQALVTIPFPDDSRDSFSIRSVKYNDKGQPISGNLYPILYETNLHGVGDLSAVDGANYLLNMQQSYGSGTNEYNIVDFKTNPCDNDLGCNNPSIDGTFKNPTNLEPQFQYCLNDPIPGKKNGDPPTPEYYIALDYGAYTSDGIDHTSVCWNTPPSASTLNLCGTSCKWCKRVQYSTEVQKPYCYSHSDASSSPQFQFPWKVVLTYSDLKDGNDNRTLADLNANCDVCPKSGDNGNKNITKNAQPIRNCNIYDNAPSPSKGTYYCQTSKTSSDVEFTDCIYQCINGDGPPGPNVPPTKPCPTINQPGTEICQVCENGNNPCPKNGNSYYVGTFANGSVGCREEGDASYQGPFPLGSVTSQCFFNCKNYKNNCAP